MHHVHQIQVVGTSIYRLKAFDRRKSNILCALYHPFLQWHIKCYSKVKYMSICIAHHRQEPLMRSRDHLPYGITHCHLPPSRRISPNFTPGIHQYSFYHAAEGGRLSRPMHCSKGAQSMPKAVYHTRPRWALILGPNTPQSSILPLDHCDLATVSILYDTLLTVRNMSSDLP